MENKKRKIKVLAQNERLNKKFGNVTELKQALFKKRKKSNVQYFKFFLFFSFFIFVIFYILCTLREKK